MNQSSKLYTATNIRNTFFSEISIGISGNSVLLLFHVLMSSREHKPRLTDMPIGVLAIVHLLMLLVVGVIATDMFISRQGWDDITCKSLVFLYRFLRGLSICTTCLLSVLQAITLSPRHSCLAKFKKSLSPCHSLWSLLALCFVYSSISSNLLVYIVITPNVTSDHLLYVTESCSLLPFSFPVKYIMSTLFVFREAFFLGVMGLSSGYMVVLLCRHKKQSQHLHSTSLSPKASPEERATRTILLLMSFFVLISILDSFMSFSRHMFKDDPIFYCVQILVSHSYASVSPFVFISTEKDITRLLRSMCERIVTICLFSDR
nr:vomeronasal type-1 receptor 48-like [Peromyscus maniculatus bairdii]